MRLGTASVREKSPSSCEFPKVGGVSARAHSGHIKDISNLASCGASTSFAWVRCETYALHQNPKPVLEALETGQASLCTSPSHGRHGPTHDDIAKRVSLRSCGGFRALPGERLELFLRNQNSKNTPAGRMSSVGPWWGAVQRHCMLFVSFCISRAARSKLCGNVVERLKAFLNLHTGSDRSCSSRTCALQVRQTGNPGKRGRRVHRTSVHTASSHPALRWGLRRNRDD